MLKPLVLLRITDFNKNPKNSAVCKVLNLYKLHFLYSGSQCLKNRVIHHFRQSNRLKTGVKIAFSTVFG